MDLILYTSPGAKLELGDESDATWKWDISDV